MSWQDGEAGVKGGSESARRSTCYANYFTSTISKLLICWPSIMMIVVMYIELTFTLLFSLFPCPLPPGRLITVESAFISSVSGYLPVISHERLVRAHYCSPSKINLTVHQTPRTPRTARTHLHCTPISKILDIVINHNIILRSNAIASPISSESPLVISMKPAFRI